MLKQGGTAESQAADSGAAVLPIRAFPSSGPIQPRQNVVSHPPRRAGRLEHAPNVLGCVTKFTTPLKTGPARRPGAYFPARNLVFVESQMDADELEMEMVLRICGKLLLLF
jgi:hypothetical protein